MKDVAAFFGCRVFGDDVMKERLPADVYAQLRETIDNRRHLEPGVANEVANAMKDWAIENGATHYTHWFQPLNGITAEKHDSFISPCKNGKVIMDFSGKELIQGEPDASSFPSGGLRTTFEARGYTAWDATSYAFIKEGVLCIPTAFCSYGGHALDKKTPLLRSMQAVSKQALRVIKLFGNDDVKRVDTTVGAEQEYFLIDSSVFEKRKDLIYTGRTLFGARPPKGQDLDDHYFGTIKPRVQAYMTELNEELWRLGIPAKTEHNESAPAQHELAQVFVTSNIAADHNQLTMEIMQKLARKHGMVCLLHEKPFAGVNGSGKHNNWSLSTDTGKNLLNPGDTPSSNAQFLLFLCAVIKAVDEYADLLRISIASAGNDHRLGASEAPPAIISIFLGDELTAILDAIENDIPYGVKEKEYIKIGVHTLPKLPKDTTDRNRTSPFAFTGNKFEFRMPGAPQSISDPNVVINTAVAEELRQFADVLENSENFENDLHEIIKKTISEHKRVIFNGNGYDASWVEEAEKRGLENLVSTPDCLPCMLREKNIALFTAHKVYSYEEIHARYEILMENYAKVVCIEALTMLDMLNRDILPAVSAFSAKLLKTLSLKKENCIASAAYEQNTLNEISALNDKIFSLKTELEKTVSSLNIKGLTDESAKLCRTQIIPVMAELRKNVDILEHRVATEFWPYPSTGEIIFSVK